MKSLLKDVKVMSHGSVLEGLISSELLNEDNDESFSNNKQEKANLEENSMKNNLSKIDQVTEVEIGPMGSYASTATKQDDQKTVII